MVKKIYCYVDENGQDTQGRVFVVSVVITGENRDELLTLCEQLEKISGKKKDRWGSTKHGRRMRYISHIFADDRFEGLLRYQIFKDTKDYDSSTVTAIVSAVKWDKPIGRFTTLVYVDGLSKTKRQEYGARLRHLGLPLRRIRGVARDETNALTRLADSIAGFVRDAIDGKSEEIRQLFKKAKQDNILVEVPS
ncbi:hypothetical protein HYT02_05490 [Candidatus Gottesmanbacteria bacterium]|nr:hypothetical protein [Candidatus Gottesmanbacteria bacterium]